MYKRRARGPCCCSEDDELRGGSGEIQTSALAKIGQGLEDGVVWEGEESGEKRCELRVELGAGLYSRGARLGPHTPREGFLPAKNPSASFWVALGRLLAL